MAIKNFFTKLIENPAVQRILVVIIDEIVRALIIKMKKKPAKGGAIG